MLLATAAGARQRGGRLAGDEARPVLLIPVQERGGWVGCEGLDGWAISGECPRTFQKTHKIGTSSGHSPLAKIGSGSGGY